MIRPHNGSPRQTGAACAVRSTRRALFGPGRLALLPSQTTQVFDHDFLGLPIPNRVDGFQPWILLLQRLQVFDAAFWWATVPAAGLDGVFQARDACFCPSTTPSNRVELPRFKPRTNPSGRNILTYSWYGGLASRMAFSRVSASGR